MLAQNAAAAKLAVWFFCAATMQFSFAAAESDSDFDSESQLAAQAAAAIADEEDMRIYSRRLDNVAGEKCPAAASPSADAHRKGAQLAAQTLAYLRASDAKVALLARAGSDAPQKRFVKKIGFWNYTHAGLAYRDHPEGAWTIVHLLNTCREHSGVFAESVVQFFLDSPHEYRAVVAVPAAPMQDALADLIVRADRAAAYKNESVYSSISYPFSLARQNSNEYILDTFAAALAQMENENAATKSRTAAKNYFLSSPHRKKFAPEILRAGFVEVVGAHLGLGPDNATLADHSFAENIAGEFEFVSAGALIEFWNALDMLLSAREFALADISRAKEDNAAAEQ